MKIYKKEFYRLVDSYITIKKEYQFIFDEFLEHLILDCEELVEKNYNPHKNRDSNDTKIEYTLLIFRGLFYNHIKSREWFDKIYNPEKCTEVIKRVRKNKLDIINDRLFRNNKKI